MSLCCDAQARLLDSLGVDKSLQGELAPKKRCAIRMSLCPEAKVGGLM